MRKIPDRFWWLEGALGIILVIFSLIFLGLAATQAVVNFWKGEEVEWIFLFLTGGGCGLFFALSISHFRRCLQARKRFLCRINAIQGNQQAMPRAAIRTSPENAPDLSGGPLELFWRTTMFGRRVWLFLYIVFLLIFGSTPGVGAYFAYLIISTNPLALSLSAQGAFLVIDIGVLVIIPFIVIVVFTRYLPALSGKLYGMSVNTDGLFYYPEVGHSQFVRWEEICLFEVTGYAHRLRYRLYGNASIVEWWNQPPSKLVSLGITSEEFLRRHQALLNLIVARTHLQPRSFAKKLAIEA